MNKPITIIVDEFKNKMVNLINNSGIPFFIIESILKDLIQEVHIASQKQLESDKARYNKTLNESKSEKDGD